VGSIPCLGEASHERCRRRAASLRKGPLPRRRIALPDRSKRAPLSYFGVARPDPDPPLLVVLDQAIDTTTPARRLLFHVLAAISEFERDLIRERVIAGVRRAKKQGRHLGRPRQYRVDTGRVRELLAAGMSLRAVGRALGVPHVSVSRALAALS
jgi:Resolvase, N terminal domain